MFLIERKAFRLWKSENYDCSSDCGLGLLGRDVDVYGIPSGSPNIYNGCDICTAPKLIPSYIGIISAGLGLLVPLYQRLRSPPKKRSV
ncbi:hypothetical protein Q3G72_018102 [Acer saccharum]|nr:hypothetical protein Q3G72_018102 [Acer saccharum]